jgi:predicted ATPase with chaperone activity
MFSDIIVTDQLLDQVGPALISQNSLFLYGPTGNGKTTIAERLLRIYREPVLVPYAVEVDSQIILTFELGVHEPVEAEQLEFDPRWVLCKRPYIVVGGELVSHQLELQLDESTGIYAAPLQMKANNGMFLIDDFGRQVMTPRELLNRWIVPLDRRVDHLNLRHGIKFEIPFELMVVFSTNLDPDELADEAFLRRIQNKIYIEPVSAEVFDTIFESEARKWQVAARPEDMQYLRDLCLHKWHKPLRACYPRDVCQLLTSISQYERRPVRVNPEELERATQLYFTHQKAVEDI